jgi:hypothetical protein
VREKLGEHPTVKLKQVDVARYAREADQRVVQAEAGAQPTIGPVSSSIYPEIEVSVDVANLDEVPPSVTGDGGFEPALETPKTPDDHSVVRLACRDDEEPRPTQVPCVVASKEDLSWFQLEESSHVVLAMIDGESTIESIVSALTIPRDSTFAILRELASHGVIEFHES